MIACSTNKSDQMLVVPSSKLYFSAYISPSKRLSILHALSLSSCKFCGLCSISVVTGDNGLGEEIVCHSPCGYIVIGRSQPNDSEVLDLSCNSRVKRSVR